MLQCNMFRPNSHLSLIKLIKTYLIVFLLKKVFQIFYFCNDIAVFYVGRECSYDIDVFLQDGCWAETCRIADQYPAKKCTFLSYRFIDMRVLW